MTGRRSRPPERTFVVAALLLFGALAALVAIEPGPSSVDQAVFDALERANPDRRFQWGDSLLEEAIDVALYFVADAALCLYSWKRHSLRLAFFLGASIVLHEGVILTVQQALARARPPGAFDPHGSFPSGHVANFALTLLLFLLVVRPLARPGTSDLFSSPRTARGAALLLVAYAALRVASGEHWVTDVVGSLALSTVWATATAWALRPIALAAPVMARPPSLKPRLAVRRS